MKKNCLWWCLCYALNPSFHQQLSLSSVITLQIDGGSIKVFQFHAFCRDNQVHKCKQHVVWYILYMPNTTITLIFDTIIISKLACIYECLENYAYVCGCYVWKKVFPAVWYFSTFRTGYLIHCDVSFIYHLTVLTGSSLVWIVMIGSCTMASIS